MYVTGMVSSATPASARTSQASSTWWIAAMSAIEQPAARSGRITACLSEVRMSALSAMKWTPQKMMNSASGRAGEPEGVAGPARELDDLRALGGVAENERALAQSGALPAASDPDLVERA